MATLILTAVGSVFGGPVGGALGALVGGTIDRAVLSAPGKREGPRLTDLAVQTSSYGSQIPRLFGTTRVAGTVIWSTDLIETRANSRAGKGQPTVTSYSYSASFAVLVSARPIRSIGRIWADGNLLRGAGGDWKATTGFRLHTGDEDQPVDPLIAAAVGLARTPAHRGGAYAVFENLQLASFGNRIPSLTFEVVADDGPIGIGAIAAALAPEIADRAALPVAGFAASGGSTGAAVSMLATAGGAWLAAAGDGLTLRSDAAIDATIVDQDVTVAGRAGHSTRTIAPIETVPRAQTVSYYDPARDYQAGLQQARRPGAGVLEQRLELPAVIDAAGAKAIADAALARAEAARTTRSIALGLDGLAIAPGSCVAIAGEDGGWRVVDSSVEGYAVSLTLTPLTAPSSVGSASSGQVVAAPDLLVGVTLIEALELPGLDDQPLSAPRLTIAATGTGTGWRQAALLVSTDDGASWTAAGTTGAAATMGTIEAPVPPAPSTLFDDINTVVVALARPDMTLEEADDRRLDAGANLAVVGDELIQFGRAVALGGGRWRLSRLLRGRRGTEPASGTQAAGDRFVLLESDTVRTLDLPLASLGTRVRVMASGVGDVDTPAEAAAVLAGRSVLPPAPVHVAVTRDAAMLTIAWTRRSRAGWRWIDGIDTPLVEESEGYRVTVAEGDDERLIDTASPSLSLPASVPAGPVTIGIVQRGTFGPSLVTATSIAV